MTKRATLCCLCLAMLATPLLASSDVTPVQATWLFGKHTLPASARGGWFAKTYQQSPGKPEWTQIVEKDIKPGLKLPAVLYLHGCNGWSKQDDVYRDLLAKEGYAVFMPDSFQRPGRQACGKQGALEERVRLRTEEVEYALMEIRNLPWVDQGKLILMGYSEGGNTTDNWSKARFAAHIVTGSACTLVGGKPAAPPGVPVLAIVGEKDHYRPGHSCSIDRTVGGSRSIVIPGGPHGIAEFTETQEAIRTFLRQCCS